MRMRGLKEKVVVERVDERVGKESRKGCLREIILHRSRYLLGLGVQGLGDITAKVPKLSKNQRIANGK